MRRWHLVQVCNVGTIVGGTGACAWTVSQSLPDWRHTILFMSRITPETQRESRSIDLRQITRVTESLLTELSPDMVLYHNTRRARVDDDCLHRPSLYYHHSRSNLWEQITSVACSSWLAELYPEEVRPSVLYQAVPRPLRGDNSNQRNKLGQELRVGRICTPTDHKWPRELIPFYRQLADRHPTVRWEFVGCPAALQADLQQAVHDKARFHSANWSSRSHFWDWDISLYHHPSLTESFGRPVAEAMRTGCIPVVDNRGGFREQLKDQSGFLCDHVEDFSNALTTLSDPSTRISRSRRCRALGDDHFSLSVFRDRLLSTFQRVVAVNS